MNIYEKIIFTICWSTLCFCQTGESISELIDVLYHSDWREQCVAIRKLGNLGATTASREDTIHKLGEILLDSKQNFEMRKILIHVFRRMNKPLTIEYLQKGLEDKDIYKECIKALDLLKGNK